MQQNNKTLQIPLALIMLQKKKKHNPNWPQILGHPDKILIIGGSGSEKRKSIT